MPRCTCDCKCGAAKEVSKILEQEKVLQFLMGLDSAKINTVRPNILAMEPFPTLNKVYANIIGEKRQQQFA